MREIKKIEENIYEIPPSGGMRVPGRVYADDILIQDIIRDNPLDQVRNVACLPGIVSFSLAMPDIHFGYGFPIGGVAAFRADEGIISPGGVGYDINCGVRVLVTDLSVSDVMDKRHDILTSLFRGVPCGVGSKYSIQTPSRPEFFKALKQGSRWAYNSGFHKGGDPFFSEESGFLKGADPDAVSQYAVKRGIKQLGTLGSGNHFLELDRIEEIYDSRAAEAFGLVRGNCAVQIHTGSRGFGHQVCDDTVKALRKKSAAFGIDLPDKQLVCAPLGSPEAEKYFAAMACAANFAWANRQIISHTAVETFEHIFGASAENMGMRLLYDVCHNIATFETHTVNGCTEKLCVHRKGATRAFPPGSEELPPAYRKTGQPVLIPGDMGNSSYICRGTERAAELTFKSSCHGAGRVLSRKAAVRQCRQRDIFRELDRKGIELIAKSGRTAAEEMPDAYKDSTRVVNIMHSLKTAVKVARLEPFGVIKG